MKQYRVVITNSARRDILGTTAYLSNESIEYARRWRVRIGNVFRALELLPHRCSKAPESDDTGRELRQILFGSGRHVYRIVFEISDDDVKILNVFHGARDEHIESP